MQFDNKTCLFHVTALKSKTNGTYRGVILGEMVLEQGGGFIRPNGVLVLENELMNIVEPVIPDFDDATAEGSVYFLEHQREDALALINEHFEG